MSSVVTKQCWHLRNGPLSALYPPKYCLARLSPGAVPLKTCSLPSIKMHNPSCRNY